MEDSKKDRKVEKKASYVTREEKDLFMSCLKRGIRNISKQEFKQFSEIKDKLEYLMIQKLSIIVTTCKAAKG